MSDGNSSRVKASYMHNEVGCKLRHDEAEIYSFAT